MDRTRRHSPDQFCPLVRRSPLGFYCQSFRFEGGGRHIIGLNRTGKSCRLRWVNYLHPGLKRGKMTPQEEKLVLELHEKWGNRWSRIARKLPGRTDNEIKNYWRTHMRKKAQQKKKDIISPSSSTSSLTSCSESTVTATVDSTPFPEPEGATFYDTGGNPSSVKSCSTEVEIPGEPGYSMDDIWKDIESNIDPLFDGFSEQGCSFSGPSMASPAWDYCSDSLWKMDEEQEGKMFEYGTMFLTG